MCRRAAGDGAAQNLPRTRFESIDYTAIPAIDRTRRRRTSASVNLSRNRARAAAPSRSLRSRITRQRTSARAAASVSCSGTSSPRPWRHEIAATLHVGRHDRTGRGRRLDQRPRHAFAVRQQHRHMVGPPPHGGDVVGGAVPRNARLGGPLPAVRPPCRRPAPRIGRSVES